MHGKLILCFAAICLSAVSGDPNNPNHQACKDEVSKLTTTGPKMPCMMACYGIKDGWLNPDYSINVAKKIERGSTKFSGAELESFKSAVTKCKDEAKGSTDYCTAGNKISECMKRNNAPRPSHVPRQQ